MTFFSDANAASPAIPPAYLTRLHRLSWVLGSLALASLLIALTSFAKYGLNTPLTHGSNGVAAILLVVFLINEKISPRPWLPRVLRAQSPVLALGWVAAFYGAGAGGGFLLLILQRQWLALLVMLFATAAGFWVGRRTGAQHSRRLMNAGSLCGVIGMGWLYLDGSATSLVATGLLGLGYGLLPCMGGRILPLISRRHTRQQAIQLCFVMLFTGVALSLALVTLVQRLYPQAAGITCAFGLLTVFSLCAWLAGVFVESPQGRQVDVQDKP